MDGKAGLRAVLLCASVTLAAGCGGGDKATDRPAAANDRSKRTGSDRGLPAAIEPRCGLEDFKKLRVAPVTGPEKTRGWSLEYGRTRSTGRAGETTSVVLVEVSPSSRLAAPEAGAREVDVSGRGVRLTPPARPGLFFSAQWRTSRATYTMLANGTRTQTLRRIISCLP